MSHFDPLHVIGRLNHENLCRHPDTRYAAKLANAACQFNYLRDPLTGQGVGQEELIQIMVTLDLMREVGWFGAAMQKFNIIKRLR